MSRAETSAGSSRLRGGPAGEPSDSPYDPTPPGIGELAELLRGRTTVVLTGAGCSTESGIPDYRGPEGRFRKRAPMRYREFTESHEARRRYWARSAVGWPRFHAARPNPAHRALAALEEAGSVAGVITQNVDGLHQAAGSRRVVELHGALDRVRCLECGRAESRAGVQDRLLEMNPGWTEGRDRGGAQRDPRRFAAGSAPERPGRLAPDGDAEVDEGAVDGFLVPECRACGGVLKPDVVFFGETVPPETVEEAWRLFERADVLLVAGSSLAVFSGRRFVYRADRDGVPVALVNLGPTRADETARIKVEGRVGAVLPRLARSLTVAER